MATSDNISGVSLSPSFPPKPGHSGRTLLLAGGVIVWSCLLIVGLKVVADYSTAQGTQEAAPATWPAESSLSPVPGRSTFVMFVHPKCPCSRASLAELNVIMNTDHDHASAFVVFLRPNGVEANWEHTDTWEAAGRIPHATRIVDENGAEARRFGARTSGHVVLYDPKGHLQFSGGITDSRGHAGDNLGRQTVLELLASTPTDRHAHAVFGCPLADQETNAQVTRNPL